MNHTSTGPARDDPGYGAWIMFWGELVVLALLVVLGAVFASADLEPGDYACGLILGLAAIALALLRIKGRFDGREVGWGGFLLVDDMANLAAAIVVFVILGLIGLVIAGEFDHGGLHDAGVALFIASALAIFLSLKHVFDMQERRR